MSVMSGVRRTVWRLPWLLSVLAVPVACAPFSHSTSSLVSAASASGQYVPGEVLVQFRPGTTHERIVKILLAEGLRIKRELGMPYAYLVKPTESLPVHEIIARLSSHPEVEYVEPNWVRRIGPPSPPVPTKPAPNG